MRIHNRQLALFDPTAEDDLVEETSTLFTKEFPDLVEDLPPEDVREPVRAGLSRARRHGLTSDIPRVTFVAYMFEFAPNFDEHPKFRAILGDEEIDPDLRMDVLTAEADDADWESVRDAYDETA